MPIFEYECAKCKTRFELLVSADSEETVKCPQCSSRRVGKLFSCFSVSTGKAGGSGSSQTSGACTTCTTKNCGSCG